MKPVPPVTRMVFFIFGCEIEGEGKHAPELIYRVLLVLCFSTRAIRVLRLTLMWRSYKLFCDTQLANVNFFEPYEVKLCICWTRSPAANMLRPPFPSESIDEKPSIWGAHRTIFALLLRLNVTKCSFFPYPTIATAHIAPNTPILLPQIRASIANSAPRASEQRIRNEKPTTERDCASPRTAKSNVEHSRVRTYFYRYGLRGAHPTFLRSKSWRLSLKTSLFLSKSPQLSRKSADVFIF